MVLRLLLLARDSVRCSEPVERPMDSDVEAARALFGRSRLW